VWPPGQSEQLCPFRTYRGSKSAAEIALQRDLAAGLFCRPQLPSHVVRRPVSWGRSSRRVVSDVSSCVVYHTSHITQ